MFDRLDFGRAPVPQYVANARLLAPACLMVKNCSALNIAELLFQTPVSHDHMTRSSTIIARISCLMKLRISMSFMCCA